MTNRALAKGTNGENAVVTALRRYFPMAERRAKQGNKDRGDVGGVCQGVVIEVKAAPKRYEIAEWLKEADVERVNDNAELAVVWFKLKGKTDARDWPVMMRGSDFLKLLSMWASSRAFDTYAPARDGEQLKLF